MEDNDEDENNEKKDNKRKFDHIEGDDAQNKRMKRSLSPEERKEKRKIISKRSRDELKRHFQMLQSLIPELNANAYTTPMKTTVLQEATAKIVSLQEQVNGLNERKRNLEQSIQTLKRQNEEYRKQIMAPQAATNVLVGAKPPILTLTPSLFQQATSPSIMTSPSPSLAQTYLTISSSPTRSLPLARTNNDSNRSPTPSPTSSPSSSPSASPPSKPQTNSTIQPPQPLPPPQPPPIHLGDVEEFVYDPFTPNSPIRTLPPSISNLLSSVPPPETFYSFNNPPHTSTSQQSSHTPADTTWFKK